MKRKHSSGGHEFNPETLALGLGYDPTLSEGAVKPPIFLTSTFQFSSAAEGKRLFELAYNLREREVDEASGLIYSRLNNPGLQILEERIAAWDKTEVGAAFASGMAAISTTLLALLGPGDRVLCSAPVYGGTHYLLENVLSRFGIEHDFVPTGDNTPQDMLAAGERTGDVRVIFLETPANPSNALVDIAACADVARQLSTPERRCLLLVDNTFLGPVFQRPAPLGADLVLYSATKFIGGHSDLVAGVVTGPAELMAGVVGLRTIMGTMLPPFSGWLLQRSLETLSIRMRRQAKNARALATLLAEHPKVRNVRYPTLLDPESEQARIYNAQCTGPGSLITFDIDGGEDEAFAVLDTFEVFRLAVSLGGTESLVEHPMAMTHSDVPPVDLEALGVTAGTIRMSVGIEHLSDLKRDVRNALGVLG